MNFSFNLAFLFNIITYKQSIKGAFGHIIHDCLHGNFRKMHFRQLLRRALSYYSFLTTALACTNLYNCHDCLKLMRLIKYTIIILNRCVNFLHRGRYIPDKSHTSAHIDIFRKLQTSMCPKKTLSLLLKIALSAGIHSLTQFLEF